MRTAFEKDFALAPFRQPARQSLDTVLAPLDALAARSPNLIRKPLGDFECGGARYALPRYVYLGPKGGGDALCIGIFAAIHGDEPEGALALARFVAAVEASPDIAKGYALYLYPVCNPTGFEDGTRHARAGGDLNREFWTQSPRAEVRLLEGELTQHRFHGIITLHTDDTSDGIYGYAHGPVIAEHLLRPALDAGAAFLPRNDSRVIDGFPAREGVIRAGYEGVLRSPPGVRPRPFEIVLETPQHAPNYLQESALAVALHSILDEYRKFIAYAQNI